MRLPSRSHLSDSSNADPSERCLRSRNYLWNFLYRLLGITVACLAALFLQPTVTHAAPFSPPYMQQPTATPTASSQPLLQVGNGTNAVERHYRDPLGLYSIPVPQNWQSERVQDYLILTSPQAQIQIYILTIPGESVTTAIKQAWSHVDPTFAMQPKRTLEMPSLNDLEKILTVTYDDGAASGELVLALGQQYEGIVYIALTRGQLRAFEQRVAQVRLIQSGFTLYSLRSTNLRKVEPRRIDRTILADLEGYVGQLLKRYHVPGASVVVVQGNQVVYQQGFGVRRLGSTEPVLPSTRMMIGSISKTMTTMMMAALVDRGVFSWDTLVVDVLPTFGVANPRLSKQLTIRNLVCSCTGVPRRDFELFFQGADQSAEDVIESLKTYQLFTKFGETFQYSNQMVATGGYVAAAADGVQYGKLYDGYVTEMAQRIFAPIGMARTTFSFADATADANYAAPHSVNLEMKFQMLPLHFEEVVTPVAPAGGAWSTAEDLGRYLVTLLDTGRAPTGEQVVSPWNLGVTWQPQVPVSAQTSYGLGWFVEDYKGVRLLQHGGNTLGFTADLAFLPEANIGIAVLTNAQGVNFVTEAIRYHLLELIYGQEPRYDDYAHYRYELLARYLGDAAVKLGALDMKQAANYLGRYTNPELGTIQLVTAHNQLQLITSEAKVALRPQLNAQQKLEGYVIYSPPLAGIPVQLTQDDQGKPLLVLGVGATQYTFARTCAPESTICIPS